MTKFQKKWATFPKTLPEHSGVSRKNSVYLLQHRFPAGNYLLKSKNKNTRTKYEICSKLTIKTPSLLLTLNIFYTLF